MKIQTVNQLISVFKDISTRHYQINGFGIGDNWENGASEAKMHPVLWINPTTATMPSTDTGYKTFEIDFEVRVFDLVNKDESNENEVLSDCIDILKDIITEFKGHPYYVNSQLNIIDDISFEAFTEEFDEEVSGWVCEISLMTPILTSFCGIPSADITGFEFPGIDCPDVNVLCPVFVEDVTGIYPIVVNTIGTTKEISLAGGVTDTFVISGEYDNGTLTLTRNDSVDVVVTGFENDYTTAATLSGNIITFDRTDTAAAYSVDLTTAINSAPDKFVQSGAYDEPNEKIVLTLNDASTVDIDTSAISGGGGGASIYTANDTIGTGRVATLTDTLTFKDGTVNIQGAGTSTGSALSIYDNDTTPNKLWEFLDNGSLTGNKAKCTFSPQNNTTNSITDYVFNIRNFNDTANLFFVGNGGEVRFGNAVDNGTGDQSTHILWGGDVVTQSGSGNYSVLMGQDVSANYSGNGVVGMGRIISLNAQRQAGIGDTINFIGEHNYGIGRKLDSNAPHSNMMGVDLKSNLSYSNLIGRYLETSATGASLIGNGNTTTGVKLVNNTAYSLGLGWGTTTPQHLFKSDGVNLTLPTSSAGLSSGDLWNDGGTVKIV